MTSKETVKFLLLLDVLVIASFFALVILASVGFQYAASIADSWLELMGIFLVIGQFFMAIIIIAVGSMREEDETREHGIQ